MAKLAPRLDMDDEESWDISAEDEARLMHASFNFMLPSEAAAAEPRPRTPGGASPAAEVPVTDSHSDILGRLLLVDYKAGEDSGGGKSSVPVEPEPQLPLAVKISDKALPYGMDVVELRRVKDASQPWQVCLRSVYDQEFDPNLR